MRIIKYIEKKNDRRIIDEVRELREEKERALTLEEIYTIQIKHTKIMFKIIKY